MSTPLTREDYVADLTALCGKNDLGVHFEIQDELLAHDAALREKLRRAQMAIDDNAQCCAAREKVEQQLAEMTQERDEAREVALVLAECRVTQHDIDWATIALNLCRKGPAQS